MSELSSEHIALQEQILEAKAQGRILQIRGFGTKDFYHPLNPRLDTENLSTQKLKGIINYEPSELFIQVAAGTSLQSVETLLHTHGQCLPFEPPRFIRPEKDALCSRDASIGGMVASGLSGPARASVGAVKDFILGAHLINGQAEHMVFGGQVMKNVAGYDVSRVLASSMGTLGVITEVTLKVLPQPLGDLSLLAKMSAEEAQVLLLRLGQLPLPLHSSTCVNPLSKVGHHELDFTLRLKGANAATQSALERIQSELKALNREGLVLPQANALEHWERVRDQTHVFFSSPTSPTASLWRVSLPLKSLKLGVPSFAQESLTEWFGALHWVWAEATEILALQEEVARLKGSMDLWRTSEGTDRLRLQQFNTPIEANSLKLQTQLQQAFDPSGVFKTGRAQP